MQNDDKYIMIEEEPISYHFHKEPPELGKPLSENDIIKMNDLKQELGRNFIEYAYAVNSDRAIPDAKSGLKPVAKRILWSAFEEGRTFSKPHVKSARIVGDVMGRYHPHGDSSIYGAMVRLSQDWVLRYPLIDWHGSNGNQAGDGPAAARYTEARLSKLAEDGLLQGIKKRNVDFILNYDETLEEPVTLPSIFPNLLCNPNTGIGVAMACNWLPHNLKEVANAINNYLDGEEPTLPGPDFPTGGIIINKDDIPNIMKTGHGSVKVRGKYKLEKNNIVFYEIPYGTTIEGLLAEIGEVCDAKEIEGISEARDESNKKGVRIVVECKKGVNPDSIAMKLFAKTNLQTSISYNQVALVDKTPTELNLKQAIEIYVKHNIVCLKKEFQFDLTKAKERLHIVEGLLIALEDIDNVIALIKKSESSSAAKEALIVKYNLSEAQAKAILAMRLSSLARLEKLELENEKKELVSKIAEIEDILTKEEKQIAIIRERLDNLVKKYGDDRRTELAQIEVPKEEKEKAMIVPVDVVVVTTQSGDIKRIPKSSFRVQKRNGKGVKTLSDAILSTVSTNTVDTLLIFTNKGKMYRLLVDKIPEGTNASKGTSIASLISLDDDEKVEVISSITDSNKYKYVVFFTKNGLIKKTELSEYINTKKTTGIQAIKFKEGDSLANVDFLNDEEVIVITQNGMSIRFETAAINATGRASSGVKAISLKEGDVVLKGLVVKDEKEDILLVTSNGLCKKIKISDFTSQGRGGKGVICYKLVSGATVVGAAAVNNDSVMLVIGKPNSICVTVGDVQTSSKDAQGVKIISNSSLQTIVRL
jgi:DNA gyrase subunit A